MVEEQQRDEEYWRKVAKIDRGVGCSHHPQAGLELVQQNDWSATGGITPNYFLEDASFRLVSGKALERLSPRQRVAYETVRKWFMQAPGLAYLGGRSIRHGFSMPDEDVPLDNIVFDGLSDYCAGVCVKKAYTIEFPFSSTLDKIVGGLAGVAVAPLAFIAGLVYTPRKNQEQTEGYTTIK